MDRFSLHESRHSRVTHAHGFRIPGYLIVEPLREVVSLSDLDANEVADFGESLALAEALVREVSQPERVYVLKYGESNARVHFHIVPRTRRILDGYLDGRSEEPPFSGASITDWLWFHGESLGFTDNDVDAWVSAARTALPRFESVERSWRAMAAAAARYCEWAETQPAASTGQPEDFEDACGRIAGALSAASALAPPGDDAAGHEFRETATWLKRQQRVRDRVAELPAEPTPDMGWLYDDLVDIWRDLSRGLELWREGHLGDAVYGWHFGYHHHWGQHAVDALRRLHFLKQDDA